MSLAVFNIEKSRDSLGREITPTCEYANSILRQVRSLCCRTAAATDLITFLKSHPVKFPCSITPRSEEAALLIRAIDNEHPHEGSDLAALESVKWDEEGDTVFNPW